MKQKQDLSFWKLWNLSFGFFGVQIAYALQSANISRIFATLGADPHSLSYFWILPPLMGILVQPIVGTLSDRTWCRFGRRIPYILGGALISTIALMLMPNCPTLLALAPLAMGAFILLFMDLSFNVTMQPFRALVADMLDDSQKTEGYVVQTFLINIGAVIGAILPLIMTWAGVSDEAVPGQVSPHIAWSYYIGGAILLATVLVTAFKTKEYPPKEFAEYNGLAEVNAGEAAEKTSFLTLLKNTPTAMIKLGITQFFSWAALFIMWTYLKPAITGSVTDGGVILSEGATQTWVGVLNGVYPIPACIAAIFMTKLAERFGNKSVYATCLTFGALGFAGLCFLTDKYALMLPMLCIGIAWAGILAMPYAILSRTVDPKRMGVYMGIFNFTITIPQIVIGLTGGVIIKYCFGSNAVMMLALACVFMLLAAISVAFIKEQNTDSEESR